ncbi:hypothetical protein ACHQM5_015227 [Ranunculus cassubicifolius]
MTKRYLVLQKKLEDIEIELREVLHLPPETPGHQLLSESLDRRFGFVRSLLSAELESSPSKPHHLYHIDQRLTELESTFREWDNFRTSSSANNFDAFSTCSCTESCLNDDGGEEDEEEEEERDEDDNGSHGGGGGELTVYGNPEFVEEDDEKKTNEAEETSIEKVLEQQEEAELMKDETGKGLSRRKPEYGFSRKKHDRIRKWFMMFALGILVVVIASVYYVYKEGMEMEVFLPPT